MLNNSVTFRGQPMVIESEKFPNRMVEALGINRGIVSRIKV